ncbi:MAG: hypothetical protein RL755_1518 [Pseudomonadota bacterium]
MLKQLKDLDIAMDRVGLENRPRLRLAWVRIPPLPPIIQILTKKWACGKLVAKSAFPQEHNVDVSTKHVTRPFDLAQVEAQFLWLDRIERSVMRW